MAAKAADIDPHGSTYRDVLNNIGGFGSCADRTASREGFIAVMAFFEKRAGGTLPRSTAGYWQEQDVQANPRDAYVHNIHGLARGLGLTDKQLDDFIAGPKMSNGLYSCLDDAPVAWLAKILNALRAMTKRKECKYDH